MFTYHNYESSEILFSTVVKSTFYYYFLLLPKGPVLETNVFAT